MSRMVENKFSPVDAWKVKKALEEHGTYMAQASRELGFCETYLSNTLGDGRIRVPIIKMLEKIYGITYDEIKPDPEPEPVLAPEPTPEPMPLPVQEQPQQSTITIDYNALREMILYGVAEGIKAILTDKATWTQMYNELVHINKDGWRLAWREQLEEKKGHLTIK